MDIESLQSVSKSLDEPVWVEDDIHGLKGVRLCIVAFGSKQVRRAIGRKMRALGKEHLDAGGIPSDEIQDLAEDEMNLSQLVDWEGFTSQGKEVKFDPETAKKMASASVFWSGLVSAINHVNAKSNEAAAELEKN